MRIEELSIGDWVKWQVYDKTYDIRITQITDTLVRGVHDGIEYGMLLKQISPIPLTPEILEKNGVHFVENFEDDECLFACPMFSVIWLKGRGEWKFCVPNAWLYIRSVHQLQHALRLAGIEKEIEV